MKSNKLNEFEKTYENNLLILNVFLIFLYFILFYFFSLFFPSIFSEPNITYMIFFFPDFSTKGLIYIYENGK